MLKKIAKQFRQPAGLGGKIISAIMEKGNSVAYEKLLKKHYSFSGGKILEIGYGPGYGINLISENDEKSRIDGIDFSGLMYKKCFKRYKRLVDEGKLNLYLGDFLTYDFGENKYDRIFSVNVIYFWEELVNPFKKIHSLLKNDGVFCFYFSHKTDLDKLKFTKGEVFNKYDIETVTGKLKEAGFKNIKSRFDYGYYVKAERENLCPTST